MSSSWTRSGKGRRASSTTLRRIRESRSPSRSSDRQTSGAIRNPSAQQRRRRERSLVVHAVIRIGNEAGAWCRAGRTTRGDAGRSGKHVLTFGHEQPHTPILFRAAGHLRCRGSETPEIIGADRAADCATRILCQYQTVHTADLLGPCGRDEERITERKRARIDGNRTARGEWYAQRACWSVRSVWGLSKKYIARVRSQYRRGGCRWRAWRPSGRRGSGLVNLPH